MEDNFLEAMDEMYKLVNERHKSEDDNWDDSVEHTVDYNSGHYYWSYVEDICSIVSEYDQYVWDNLSNTVENKVRKWANEEHLDILGIINRLKMEWKKCNQ